VVVSEVPTSADADVVMLIDAFFEVFVLALVSSLYIHPVGAAVVVFFLFPKGGMLVFVSCKTAFRENKSKIGRSVSFATFSRVNIVLLPCRNCLYWNR
jgi:hypothetical protein